MRLSSTNFRLDFVVFSMVLFSQVEVVIANVQVGVPANQNLGSDVKSTAERLFDEGVKLYRQGTADSLRQASKKWLEALELYQKIDDKEQQSTILNSIGKRQYLTGKTLRYY